MGQRGTAWDSVGQRGTARDNVGQGRAEVRVVTTGAGSDNCYEGHRRAEGRVVMKAGRGGVKHAPGETEAYWKAVH
jgi:hypothetical protein